MKDEVPDCGGVLDNVFQGGGSRQSTREDWKQLNPITITNMGARSFDELATYLQYVADQIRQGNVRHEGGFMVSVSGDSIRMHGDVTFKICDHSSGST